MTKGYVALLATCSIVAGLGVWFAVARWDDANKVAAVASALGAVASVGVAIWAVQREPQPRRSVLVSHTGRATTNSSGNAVTGYSGTANGEGSLRVEYTGDAHVDGNGDAVTGVDLR